MVYSPTVRMERTRTPDTTCRDAAIPRQLHMYGGPDHFLPVIIFATLIPGNKTQINAATAQV